ncbi:hypothetical protein [Roseburia inulinivorans]|jgi:hypothetical protein|uniref:hypothetical protein n=1 Tax=Roseburia inulinivorans TaxID=360807 RepID=UPI003AB4C8AA
MVIKSPLEILNEESAKNNGYKVVYLNLPESQKENIRYSILSEMSGELENKLSEFGWNATADKDEMKNRLNTFGIEDILIYRVDELYRIDGITRLCKIYAPKTEGDWQLEFETDISLKELQCIINVLNKFEKI